MERIFRTVKISDRLPNMGKRVMFLYFETLINWEKINGL